MADHCNNHDNHDHHDHDHHGHDHHDHHHTHHGHEHHHPSAPAPSGDKDKDYAEANKTFFDAKAQEQPDPRWVEMAKKAGAAIRSKYAFKEDSTVLMDFACNVGLTSRELAPYTKTLVGVDISQGAVDVFNKAVSNQGIAPEDMRAVCVELKGEEGELDGLKFDVITCIVSYHHFADIDKMTQMLSFFLKPGGALLVVDITKPPAATAADSLFPAEFGHVVAHTGGMTKEGMQKAYEGAGLVNFEFEHLEKVTVHEKEMMLFIAKGVKLAN
ncbi:S-adenosyl-L-methionine-dependent methyltransferase [Pholiota conissans]|uniref:S-adenosyl-L-methionine-dependent methyltransferase n=1 Tax=Pholiota conissans TaxID=109636 RepID=A0A9P5Z4B4_9AGAR|nr:S-adenosyl-L-methionine-dependent methyltransferase [Pholiota conissans]